MPLGYAATKSLTDRSESFRRSQELENMQREYEQALQEYAATKATGKARKRASLQQMAMDRLVENTVQLSQKLALIEQPRRILMNYAILAPILGGALGFMNGMGSGDSRSLAVAEARLQHAREKTNPTGSTISVAQIDAPNKDGQLSDADRKKQLRQQLVDDALDDIDTSYVE
jgi:anti-sigma factor RsiW